MSGAHRLVVGNISKDSKGEEYLKEVDKMATADGDEETEAE